MRLWYAAGAILLTCAVIASVWAAATPDDEALCAEALEERRFGEAVEVCRRAWKERPTPYLAASVASAEFGAGHHDEAWRWASLPEARREVRAQRIRGVLLNARGEEEQARAELRGALEAALEQGDATEAARAAHALAGVLWDAGQLSAAWDALEISEREARRARHGPTLALAELARGDVLRRLGDGRRADEFYRRAIEASAARPVDQAYAFLKVALSYRERGAYRLAQQHLERSLALAEEAANERLTTAVRINLAEVLALSRDVSGAERVLAQLGESVQDDWDVQVIRGRLALLRAQPKKALQYFERAEAAEPPTDAEWEIATLQGRALQQAGRDEDAAQAWAHAVDLVESLSAREPEHQGWVVARRREPYDALFTHLARTGQYELAWSVVDRLSRSEALAFTEAGGDEVRRLLEDAEALRSRWAQDHPLPASTGTPQQTDPRDVLVLHEAESRLWVGTRLGGEAKWVEVGSDEAVESALHRFLGSPDDEAAATELGERLWRIAALPPSTRPLYVGATGRLRKLALAALRAEGRYWFQHRPLARLASLAAPAPRGAGFSQIRVVAGDPGGDLPAARAEVQWVASRLGTTPRLGKRATRESILAGNGGQVLHLATHADVGLSGTRLELADGELSAQEILRHQLHARLVVLATCASAAGRDAAGSDSLATAFLQAGSAAVLGTLRTVPDVAARELVRGFYEEGGLEDPIVALARAQARLAPTQPPSIWSVFVVTVGASSPQFAGHTETPMGALQPKGGR